MFLLMDKESVSSFREQSVVIKIRAQCAVFKIFIYPRLVYFLLFISNGQGHSIGIHTLNRLSAMDEGGEMDGADAECGAQVERVSGMADGTVQLPLRSMARDLAGGWRTLAVATGRVSSLAKAHLTTGWFLGRFFPCRARDGCLNGQGFNGGGNNCFLPIWANGDF